MDSRLPDCVTIGRRYIIEGKTRKKERRTIGI